MDLSVSALKRRIWNHVFYHGLITNLCHQRQTSFLPRSWQQSKLFGHFNKEANLLATIRGFFFQEVGVIRWYHKCKVQYMKGKTDVEINDFAINSLEIATQDINLLSEDSEAGGQFQDKKVNCSNQAILSISSKRIWCRKKLMRVLSVSCWKSCFFACDSFCRQNKIKLNS